MILRLCLALVLIDHVLSHPVRHGRNGGVYRALGDLFGDDPLFPSDSGMNTALPQSPHWTKVSAAGIDGLLTVQGNKAFSAPITGASSASRTTSESTILVSTEIQESKIATSTSSSTSSPSATAAIGVSKGAPNMPPGEAAEWKVIGIAVMVIALIAAVMLSIVFFDSWTGFLCALVGRRKKSQGTEDMVPDWARRDWEFKIASEDGHRYPTLSSLESMSKAKAASLFPSPSATSPSPRQLQPMRPPSLYTPALDPHPLEPLFRRPSVSNHVVLPDSIYRA
ncbi:hypothetical protein B0H15DRAFT_811576 [Mycena belliarum]|uniref:Uncharacterized protein n=1 Tax=Mycena belliarum TaxID=1033014 RepID=A0AAD6UH74_9AGAR|nr:hypothetical protein B0H15DRAFT_811576 [Mycena belliae]